MEHERDVTHHRLLRRRGARRRWVILGVLCTSLLVMQGNTALNLALPKIAGDTTRELGGSLGIAAVAA